MLNNHIIFFDGVCNLCNGAINFVLDHDKKGKYKFAALQTEVASNYLSKQQITDMNSIVLFAEGKTYSKSTAALKIAADLNFPWFLFKAFLIFPKFLRDPIYDFIAKRRYKWFGKRETCRMPTPEEKSRFLTE